MSLPRFEYRAPGTLADALAVRREAGEDALVMAGGLTTIILMRERLARPRLVLSLSEIEALRRIEANGALSIGAMATHAEIVRSPAVAAVAPLIAEACGHVGSPAIRNMGTLGGNVCHADSASDPAPALLALDAEAVIAGPRGERRLPMTGFFQGTLTTALGGDELLAAIRIPRPAAGTASRFVKYTATTAEAFATVTVAMTVVKDAAGACRSARIGLGSVASTPIRATAAESLLAGRRLTREAIDEAARAAADATSPSSNNQGSAGYRREMTRVWVRRLLEDIAAR
ncbi:MAG: xanthine dehydrogenase family protein subunit M [Burkholderiales bacterium]|nr:xanthine dehydrogenase family protein subunit M [Burkholderiales bacterium]